MYVSCLSCFLVCLLQPCVKGLASWLSCMWWFIVCFLSLPPRGVLGQVWCLIVSIPDLCLLSYFAIKNHGELANQLWGHWGQLIFGWQNIPVLFPENDVCFFNCWIYSSALKTRSYHWSKRYEPWPAVWSGGILFAIRLLLTNIRRWDSWWQKSCLAGMSFSTCS